MSNLSKLIKEIPETSLGQKMKKELTKRILQRRKRWGDMLWKLSMTDKFGDEINEF